MAFPLSFMRLFLKGSTRACLRNLPNPVVKRTYGEYRRSNLVSRLKRSQRSSTLRRSLIASSQRFVVIKHSLMGAMLSLASHESSPQIFSAWNSFPLRPDDTPFLLSACQTVTYNTSF